MGLFIARVVGEWVGLPGAGAAILLSAVAAVSGAWLLARWPIARTWPAFILLAYLFQPEPSRQFALWVTVVALLSALLSRVQWSSVPGEVVQPIRTDRSALLIAVILFIAGLALYVATAAPDVLAADSGELQVVAAQLGVAHPPGFSLYILLAHLATRLPIGTPAYAVNVLSALFGALTVVVVYLIGRLLTGRNLPAITGALALATATTFWSQATTANVRSLTALFAALILWTTIEFRIEINQSNKWLADRRLILAAFCMGLGLTHHISLVFLIIICLIFIAISDRSLLRNPRRWVKPIGAGALGLLPLLYLPLRAGADVRGASPELATLPGFLEHVLATGFRGDLFYYISPADLVQRLGVMANIMDFQFAPILLLGMATGLILLSRRDRNLTFLIGGIFGVYTFVAATYRAPQTVEYMIPAYVAAVLALAYALGWLPSALDRLRIAGKSIATLFAALVIAAVAGQLPGHVSASGANHEGKDAREYAGQMLVEAPLDSTILAHWHWATPLWYLQEVEGVRSDVDIRFVYPEGEPYEITWARRTAEAFERGVPVVTTWLPPVPLPDLPVPEPLGEGLVFRQQPREKDPQAFTPVSLSLDGQIQIQAYRVEQREGLAFTPGEESVITVAWQSSKAASPGQSLFLHLVGPDGVLYGQDDQPARAADGVTLTQFRVTPRPGMPAGNLSLLIGLDTNGQRELLATLPGQHTEVRPLTRNPVYRRPSIGAGDTLIGYDWDHTLPGRKRLYLHWQEDETASYYTQVVDDGAVTGLELPPYRGPWGVPVAEWRFPGGEDGGQYVPLGQGIVWTGGGLGQQVLAPGDSAIMAQRLHSGRPVNRDLIVSVRLIGLEPDGFHWDWWDLQDSVPGMGAIPTLKWVTGSFVRSPHQVTVPETAPPGQALTGALTIYDAFTNRRLPILDERLTADQPWIPLGSGSVGN